MDTTRLGCTSAKKVMLWKIEQNLVSRRADFLDARLAGETSTKAAKGMNALGPACTHDANAYLLAADLFSAESVLPLSSYYHHHHHYHHQQQQQHAFSQACSKHQASAVTRKLAAEKWPLSWGCASVSKVTVLSALRMKRCCRPKRLCEPAASGYDTDECKRGADRDLEVWVLGRLLLSRWEGKGHTEGLKAFFHACLFSWWDVLLPDIVLLTVGTFLKQDG
eukprot:1150201-Pelagomonas_calceolata.AAC.1